MVWDRIRLAIFVTAFAIGTMLTGSGGSTSSAESSGISQLDEKAGTSLVVACNDGKVSIKRLEGRGAVQFNCERSNMVVVRDHGKASEKVPEFHPLRHQLGLLLIR